MVFTINASHRIDFYERLYQFSRTGHFMLGCVEYINSDVDPERLQAVIEDRVAERLAQEQIGELQLL